MDIDFCKLWDPIIWYPILSYIGLCTADFVLGVLVHRKDFNWDKVTKWVVDFGDVVVGLIALGIASAFKPEVWIAFGPALVTTIGIKTKDVIQKAMSLFKKSGVPVEDVVEVDVSDNVDV